MTSLLRMGPVKVRSPFGKGTEYLFCMPLRDRSLSPLSGTLRGLDSPFQTALSAIIGRSMSYRTYRRDNPPALIVVHGQAKEIKAVERNLLMGHTRSDLR